MLPVEVICDICNFNNCRYVTRPSPEEQWWKNPQRQQKKSTAAVVNPQPPPSSSVEKMETASDSPQDSTSGGSEVQSPAAGSEESPVFDNSNNPLSLQVKLLSNFIVNYLEKFILLF